jgi:hypothetical protein
MIAKAIVCHTKKKVTKRKSQDWMNFLFVLFVIATKSTKKG